MLLVWALAPTAICSPEPGGDDGSDMDWGDAPQPYPTLSTSNGACHQAPHDRLVYYLGSLCDTDVDGQPTSDADGDDNDGFVLGDDEDGVVFSGPLTPGAYVTVTVTSTANGFLNAWIDFNCDHDWTDTVGQVDEHVVVDQPLNQPVEAITFLVPDCPQPGPTYARFRFSRLPNVSCDGFGGDGEVEDYKVDIADVYDWGDAPSDYPVFRAANGASHKIVSTMYLGALIDAELDGQPNPMAHGDDSAGTDDEDGVAFDSVLISGQTAHLTATAVGTGYLNVWIDYNQNKQWTADELVIAHASLSNETKQLSFAVPGNLPCMTTFARCRFSSSQNLLSTGPAVDGEVEDYPVEIAAYDWGDAPDSYKTLHSSNGANHKIVSPPICLGSALDDEQDGQPSSDANGDGTDEDGIVFSGPLVYGSVGSFTVTATGSGTLNAWFDFNGNGSWSDYGEHVYSEEFLSNETKTLNVWIPTDDSPYTIDTYARFRFTSGDCFSYTGTAKDGEVEDYRIKLIQYDWGDAPSDYPTYSANNGARHMVVPGMYLGGSVDYEQDGRASSWALGDDYFKSDDEDGVSMTPLTSGQNASCTITAVGTGYLNAWLDFDNSKTWTNSEHVIVNQSLANETKTFTIAVPANLSSGHVVARFRYSSQSGLSFDGEAPDGEVEDCVFTLTATGPGPGTGDPDADCDFGDAPDSYHTSMSSNGPLHVACNGQVYYLGQSEDLEANGRPTANADGDDLNNMSDEDGVVFGSIVSGPSPSTATVDVTTSAAGYLNVWVDFDQDGTWANQPQDWVIQDLLMPATPQTQMLAFMVPANAKPGSTFARVRFSSTQGLSFDGMAGDGEVEDYKVQISAMGSQQPDSGTNGIGINAGGAYVLGDDFEARNNGPITNISLWGSWNHGVLTEDDARSATFHLSIYNLSDELLWTHDFNPGDFGVSLHNTGNAGWMDPPSTYTAMEGQKCWKYSFGMNEADQFIQQGTDDTPTVYRLVVDAENTSDPDANFGWSTSINHANGAAVWKDGASGTWENLIYPVGHALEGSQLDMAFEIISSSQTLRICGNRAVADNFWWPESGRDSEMLSVYASADSTEAINWDSIKLQASGSGNDAADITAVRLWIDNDDDRIADPSDTPIGSGVYSADDGVATISVTPTVTLTGGGLSVPVIISYSMSPSASAGSVYQFEVIGATGVTATGNPVDVTISPSHLISAKTIIGVEPTTIGSAKLEPIGTTVMLVDSEITADFRSETGWAAPWNRVYIEDLARISGIGLLGTAFDAVNVGDSVSVLGTTYLDNASELMINPIQVVVAPKGPSVHPIGMDNRRIGGGVFGTQPAVIDNDWALSPIYAAGLNNVGSLVRTWGFVTGYGSVSLDGGITANVTWIDDGSGLADGYLTDAEDHSKGIAVVTPPDASANPITGYRMVTGIIRAVPNPSGRTVRLLVPRDAANDMTDAAPVPE